MACDRSPIRLWVNLAAPQKKRTMELLELFISSAPFKSWDLWTGFEETRSKTTWNLIAAAFLLPACTRQLYTCKAMQSNAHGALALHKAEQVANIKAYTHIYIIYIIYNIYIIYKCTSIYKFKGNTLILGYPNSREIGTCPKIVLPPMPWETTLCKQFLWWGYN